MANADDFIKIIDVATDIMGKEKQYCKIQGGSIVSGFAQLKIPQNVVIIGDIHGDLKSLFGILKNIDYKRFLADPRNKMIFMGDYVDRGTQSIEVLYTICYLKQKYPHSVILMRGNHEAPIEFPFCSHDLPFKFIERYGEIGKQIYLKKILPFFQFLILFTLIENQIMIVHGGLPTRRMESGIDFRNCIAMAQENIHDGWMEEILWNDPRQYTRHHRDWEISRRGIGRHFGINISKSWLNLTGAKMIIRGHEPCRGFKIDHDGLVVTLFSCKEAYPNYEAAYLSIASGQLQSIRNGKDLTHYIVKLES
jgi:protein phosphatase